MAPEISHGSNEQVRIQEILSQAEVRYGNDAYFVYLRRTDRRLVCMNLDQAMTICGSHIAGEDNEILWATLDKWHEAASRLEAGYPDRFETSLALGRSALAKRDEEASK